MRSFRRALGGGSRTSAFQERRALECRSRVVRSRSGIDAAVVANHHVVVRRPAAGGPGEFAENFVVPPTLSGMAALSRRLAVYPGVVAVAEPTSMTWLPLAIALGDAGGRLALVAITKTFDVPGFS